VCKSRFGIDQSCLFSPHDVQESTEDVKESQAAMLRVLTVLIMLCRSSGHNLNLDGLPVEPSTPEQTPTVSTSTVTPTVTPIDTSAAIDDEPTPDDNITPRPEEPSVNKEVEEKAELERMTAQILAEKKAAEDKEKKEKEEAEEMAKKMIAERKAAEEKAQKQAQEKAEKEKLALEKLESEKLAAEEKKMKLEKEKADKEKADKEEKEKAEKLASEKLAAKEKEEKEKAAAKEKEEKEALQRLAEKEKSEKSQPQSSGATGSTWYLEGRTSEYVDIQSEVTAEILACIHNELSIESKIKLLGVQQTHAKAIQDKIVYSSDGELRQLCHEMGLGSSLSDVPQGKDRKWYVDYIKKYGRAK